MNEKIFVLINQKRTTNHILHLLLCIPTFGFWLLIWSVVAISNSSHNDKVQREIDRLLQPEGLGINNAEPGRQETPKESAASLYRDLLIIASIAIMTILSFIFDK